MLSGLAVATAAVAVGPALAAIDRLHRVDPGSGSTSIWDIDHFVLLMQENRSFDHYFGTRSGVTGFGDFVMATAFDQEPVRPFPFWEPSRPELADLTTVDPAHDWSTQHASWNDGRMDGWLSAHVQTDGRQRAMATMGYYRPADLPVHNALADAFTLCDRYFCSVMGPTGPNRLMWMSGSVGGGALSARPVTGRLKHVPPASFGWRTFPEVLTEAGVPWKVYNALPATTQSELTSTLKYFAPYWEPDGELQARGLAPRWPDDFLNDVQRSRLPAVSWIVPPMSASEHPNHPPPVGAETVMTVLWALLRNPAVWERTALIVSYDENGGFFDHLPPPVAPAGVTDERLDGAPIGLGFRVPCLVISPFSRGGVVNGGVFDHTSQLQLLARRFGVSMPNVSDWRRGAVGNLGAVLERKRGGASTPRLPSRAETAADAARAEAALRFEAHEQGGAKGSTR